VITLDESSPVTFAQLRTQFATYEISGLEQVFAVKGSTIAQIWP